MTAFVLDASIALAWCFADEATRASEQLLERLDDEEAMVPAIWPLEVANALIFGERKRRITQARAVGFLDMVRQLPIGIEAADAERAFRNVMSVARDGGLTAYDGAYLDLAMRLGVPLATKDLALQKAAARFGVSVIKA